MTDRALQWLAGMLLPGLMVACSTARPWQNALLHEPAPASQPPVASSAKDIRARFIVAVVALSGGGARAAAFGLGVLRELKATVFEWDGHRTDLLEQIGLIGGVSGGSILAAYYAAFGDETFTRFEREFLLDDFESDLVVSALSPSKLVELSSPWYGRSQVLADRLEVLYRGTTYGDLQSRLTGPDLLITATDLTTGSPFEFGPEQFALICSDLNTVPLSFAVASSSAVPILLSPTTLRNNAGRCGPGPGHGGAEAAGGSGHRTQLMRASTASYRDVDNRPYLHLVDGGLADNLGLRGLLDRVAVDGSLARSFEAVPPGTVHRLVLVVVNAEREATERINQSDRVPNTSQVIDALLFGAGARGTQTTLALLDEDTERWRRELNAVRGRGTSPFAADAQIHVVTVSLRDVDDPTLRSKLLGVPTAFTIQAADVHRLQDAGRQALRHAPAFERLVRSLGVKPARSGANSGTEPFTTDIAH